MQTSERSPSKAPPRAPGLDLLRAVAIVWVVVYHASLFQLAPRDNPIVAFGWMGVDLFFALSGFLIAGQLLRPFAQGTRPAWRRFVIRRALRTVPAYLVVLAIYFLFPVVRERPDIRPLWNFLTFTTNLGLPQGAFSHAWSLCVEEQFYLVFPVALALIALKPSPRLVFAAIGAVVLFGMALRGSLWLGVVATPRFDIMGDPDSGQYIRLIYYPTWCRLDGLLAGVVAAAIQIFRPGWWARLEARPNLALACGLAGVICAAVLFQSEVGGFFAAVFGYPLIGLSMASLVAAGAVPNSVIGTRSVPGAAALAAGSYSLYLSHKMVLHAVGTAAPGWPAFIQPLATPVALLAALAAGTALYWTVERPFLKLRDQLAGRSRTPVTATGAIATPP
jgi:peptidoglycan/LPS O-acetylase OafA/YrhL